MCADDGTRWLECSCTSEGDAGSSHSGNAGGGQTDGRGGLGTAGVGASQGATAGVSVGGSGGTIGSSGTSGDPGGSSGAPGCAADEFLCGSGECIRLALVCDGLTVHCADGSDETNCGSGGSGGVAGTGGMAASGGTSATGGIGASSATGGIAGTGATGGSGGTTGGDGFSGIIPDDGGGFIKDWDQSGVIGQWSIYEDTGGSHLVSIYPDPAGYSDVGSSHGEMCFWGTAVGHHDSDYGTNWGAGVGFSVCEIPDDTSWLPPMLASETPGTQYGAASCPTVLSGVLTITFTITGSWPELRLGFQQSESDDVAPFVNVSSAGTYTYSSTDGHVPDNWDVNNPGAVGTPNVLAVLFEIASGREDATFDFCVSNIFIN